MARLGRRTILAGLTLITLATMALAGAIAFGTADPPPPLASVVGRFQSAAFVDLPQLQTVTVRDGVAIAYRAYPAAGDRVALLIHGSSGSSSAMHPLAKALQAAGITAYAPDMRGHGSSGPRGNIVYAGQLDDDIADLAAALRKRHPDARFLLAGHSAGGGFALRLAAGPFMERFDGVVLLAPYLHWTSPTYRGDGGGWARPYVLRVIGLSILDRLGLPWFQSLPAVAFAVTPQSRPYVTPTYSYRLMVNFRPHGDGLADLRAVKRPATILVGARDEIFFADRYRQVVGAENPAIVVNIVPDVDHMGLVLDPAGIAAAQAAIERLLRTTGP